MAKQFPRAMWIKIDIDGSGRRWRLAVRRVSEFDGEEMLVFPLEDFEDYWDEERQGTYPIVAINPPTDEPQRETPDPG